MKLTDVKAIGVLKPWSRQTDSILKIQETKGHRRVVACSCVWQNTLSTLGKAVLAVPIGFKASKMSMFANILGFSLFGLAARMGQLGIQKRNPMESTFILPLPDGTWQLSETISDLAGHAIAMTVFGYGGYWAYKWDQRAAELLAEKRAEIAERRERRLKTAQDADA